MSTGADSSGELSLSAPWPAKDIVYVAIMGTVLCAAFLEWFLFLAAFLYCLIKVYQKADHWTIKFLAVLMMVIFTAMRSIFLPVMIVTLPLPPQITQHFPTAMVSFLQWFAFWTFASLLTIPWLFCIFQLVTHDVGRKKRIKHVLDESSAPKTVIVMPVYKEEPRVLLTAIDSVVDCDYPPSCLHVFLSFDGDEEDELYLKIIESLGVPLTLDSYPRSIDVTYKFARITVSRFIHGGKRKCQKSTFKLIDKIYADYLKRNDNLFILFIDSDCILDKVCIQNFMYEMELMPGSKRNMLAMTGVITSTTDKNSFITLLQDMEYVHGQLFERTVESGCGSVTCLPGALTMLRFSAFRRMAKYYFADKAEQCDDLFDYGKCHLGEDRWLTHLFMVGAQGRYQIQLCTGAFCKTEAVKTYRALMKQRRRWFLGYITNEVCMLTDIRLWKRYPLLCLVRLMQNTIRTTALLFFVMVLSIVSTEQAIANLPVGFIAVSLGLNWVLMLYFGAKLKRFKIWLYPVMFVANPFFNWAYMVYGIFTAGQRTWGGPRADAGAANAHISPQQVIEKAEATGDELNVVPETFKPAIEARHPNRPTGAPLLPSERVEGRFVPAQELPGGFYQQQNDSGLEFPNMVARDPHSRRVALHPRGSTDSFATFESATYSVYTPRRVESIFGDQVLVERARTEESILKPEWMKSASSFLDNGLEPMAVPYMVEGSRNSTLSRRSSFGQPTITMSESLSQFHDGESNTTRKVQTSKPCNAPFSSPGPDNLGCEKPGENRLRHGDIHGTSFPRSLTGISDQATFAESYELTARDESKDLEALPMMRHETNEATTIDSRQSDESERTRKGRLQKKVRRG